MVEVEAIKDILPHRYPFLLIDRITEILTEGDSVKITALKAVTANEWFFEGHFPQYKVMPGVLILEALAQTGAYQVLSMPENKGKIAFFTGCDEVRWKNQVRPGDVLMLEVTLVGEIRHGMGKGNAIAKVADKVVCQGKISFAVR